MEFIVSDGNFDLLCFYGLGIYQAPIPEVEVKNIKNQCVRYREYKANW